MVTTRRAHPVQHCLSGPLRTIRRLPIVTSRSRATTPRIRPTRRPVSSHYIRIINQLVRCRGLHLPGRHTSRYSTNLLTTTRLLHRLLGDGIHGADLIRRLPRPLERVPALNRNIRVLAKNIPRVRTHRNLRH